MSFQELAEQSAVYVQRIMELERQLGECSGAMQTLERELNLLRKTGSERTRLALTTEEAAHARSISEYISVLQSIAAEHGDIDIEALGDLNSQAIATLSRLAHRATLRPSEAEPVFYAWYTNPEWQRRDEAVWKNGSGGEQR